MTSYAKLFKYDSKGKARQWQVIINPDDPSQYAVISGLVDGKNTQSAWKQAEGTNVGRSNERTPEDQAIFETNALFEDKKKKNGYSEILEDSGKSFFAPMLAEKYVEKRLFSDDFIVQPKLDGIRCIASKDGLFSRSGKQISSCPHIESALKPFFKDYPDMIFDGELYNHEFKDDFNQIISIVRKQTLDEEALSRSKELMQYHVYDTYSSEEMIYESRYAIITSLLSGLSNSCVRYVKAKESTKDTVSEDFKKYVEEGYEGLMVRQNNLPYEVNKRSRDLMKYKSFQDEEYEIVDIVEGKGNWSGVAKVARCILPDGREFGATLKGSRGYCLDILENRDDYIGKQATVEFFELTPDGVPRFPIASKLWKEKKI